MRAHFKFSWLILFVACTFIFSPVCKGFEPAQAASDQNLQAIVDLDEELTNNTPAQFASNNLKDFFQSRCALPQEQPQEPQAIPSKTVLFQQSFINFVKGAYNKRSYAYTLSQDGSHIIQFIDLTNEMSLDASTVYVGLRLFYNKLKAAELVDDSVILYLLNTMPLALERHFVAEETEQPTCDLGFIKKHLESALLSKFVNHLPEFQTQPDAFISSLAQELALYYKQQIELAQKQATKNESRERLRNVIIRLFDMALSKTIWNPNEKKKIWHSFTGIANGLQQLGNHGIINHMDDLDDLLWTLTHRFCFYLDLVGGALPLSFYNQVEHDLGQKAVIFLEFKEQDEGVTSKKELLAEMLLQAKARAIAYRKKGIITTETI